MSKYAGVLSVAKVCRLEVNELQDLLEKENVSKDTIKAVSDMVKEPYYQLGLAYASSRAVERYIFENLVKDDEGMQDYVRKSIGLICEEQGLFYKEFQKFFGEDETLECD